MKSTKVFEKMNLTLFPGMSYGCASTESICETACFGFADVENHVVVDRNTVFHACSISKWITAILVMQFVQEGVLNLDCDVSDYLNDWKLPYADQIRKKVTLRHLLSHTAGILDAENGFYGYRRSMPSISLTDILEGKSFYNHGAVCVVNEPGTVFEYSDAGYCIVQMIVENVTGRKYDRLVQDKIFNPLGMNHSFIATRDALDKYEKELILAVGYKCNGERIEGDYALCPDLAAAGLWTTPADLICVAGDFMKSLAGEGKLLSAQSAMEIIKPAFSFGWTGLGIFRYGDKTLVSKGWGEDAQCMIKMHLDNNYIKVIMANKDPEAEQEETFGGILD